MYMRHVPQKPQLKTTQIQGRDAALQSNFFSIAWAGEKDNQSDLGEQMPLRLIHIWQRVCVGLLSQRQF